MRGKCSPNCFATGQIRNERKRPGEKTTVRKTITRTRAKTLRSRGRRRGCPLLLVLWGSPEMAGRRAVNAEIRKEGGNRGVNSSDSGCEKADGWKRMN